MRRTLATLALAALAALAPRPAQAQFTVMATTAQIQEDWKLVIAQGDAANDGPQIMSYMSPTNNNTGGYAWFMINLRDKPNPYTPGGLQFQLWDYSDNLLGSSTSTTALTELNTANETITWTQRILVNTKANTSTYEILNGSSKTWGSFGSSNGLQPVTLNGTIGLSTYDPNVSVKQSRVGYQANNVTSMTLLTVRQYDAKGTLLKTDNVNLPVTITPQ